MTITSSPNDKYAFLFTGPTSSPRFIKDIEHVYETLTQYYNYPPGNIMVVCGSTDTTPSVGVVTPQIITNAASLGTKLNYFATLMGTGTGKTALLYFTGGGFEPPAGSSDSRLIITGGDAPADVSPSWLTPYLNALSAFHVNVVMQQPFAGGFETALTSSSLAEWSFTYACKAHEPSYGDPPPIVKGSYFTYAWAEALRLEALPTGIPAVGGKYADELGAGPEGPNFLVSLQEAMAFAKQKNDNIDGLSAFSTPGYAGPVAGGAQYLGEPEFLIRDGSNGIPWYESPDIYLTHPWHSTLTEDDLFIPDETPPRDPCFNTINVEVRNVGTHPVRKYSLGIELFQTGANGPSVQHNANDKVPTDDADPPNEILLLPIDHTDIGTSNDIAATYKWNALFATGSSHRCVKAEARRLSSQVNFAWAITANDFQGQRNIDLNTMAPSPTDTWRIMRNLQGFKEHIYGIGNPFKEPRKFIMVIPEEYRKYQEIVELKWFLLPEGPQSERVSLDIVDEPVPHIPFLLEGGENQEILLYSALINSEFDEKEGIRLPFEILVELGKGERPDGVRKPMTYAADLPDYAPIAGFTVVIKKGRATLKGAILSKEGEPVFGAKVFLRTVNDLQGAVIATTEKGDVFAFYDINQDIYYIRAEIEEWSSREQIVVLFDDKYMDLHLTEKAPPTKA